MLSHSVGVRPGKPFTGTVQGLKSGARVQQRMAARPVTAMATAALEEVPSPEKRVS